MKGSLKKMEKIFNNLKQVEDVEEYRLRFEELKTYVVQLNLRWTFIGGLKENLKGTVKMFKASQLKPG